MESLLVEGGVALQGDVVVSGSKNAALPILFASILTEGSTTFSNVPNLRDIHTTVKLLNILGCEARFEDNKTYITPRGLHPEAPYDLVKTMRASILCLGPLLARIGKAKVALPGGCAIGARPVDQHLKALEKMGATFELEDGYVLGTCSKLTGAHIIFDMPTVGGTENLLMAASLAQGETVLENAAREPEIIDLANYLNACGARIEGAGTSTIRIQGVSKLQGIEYSIMPDRIEAGTFLVAAAITGGDLFVKHCPTFALRAVVEKMQAMGMHFEEKEDGLRAFCPDGVCSLSGVDIRTLPYPGFPTDMQAQLMALMALARGNSIVEESIFENRFMHVPELVRMGADISISGRTATIRGVQALKGAPVMASDLRASAAFVLAGLAAQGKTRVQRIYHLDRGYEHIETKLSAVGARIWRTNES